MNRRTFIKGFCLGSGCAISHTILYQFAFPRAEAAIPWMPLINALAIGVDLANNVFDLGEKIFGKTKLQNQTNTEQKGYLQIQVFNVLRPVQPEISIDHNITISTRAIETYDLPTITLSTAGHKVLQVRTGLNGSSAEFRSGSFCCDSRGVQRCPIPYSLSIGTECLCSQGEGVGSICE